MKLIVSWIDVSNHDEIRFALSADLNSEFFTLSEVISQKLVEKLAHMMSMFKNQKDKIDFTSWNVDFDDHNQSSQSQEHIAETSIIKSIILNKISWYYEFEKIMNERSNVISIFLSESEQSNRRNFKSVDLDDETIEKNDNSVIENDVVDDIDEKLFWNSTQSKRDSVSIASFDEIDEKINNAMKMKARIEREIKTKIQKLVARFEINNALLTENVSENSTNSHDLTQNSFFFFVARTSVFKATKFAKNVVISKFFVSSKISVSVSVTVSVLFKILAKFSTQAEFFKKFKKRVKKTYEIESDNEKKRDKKKKIESKQRSIVDALIEIENKRIKFAMTQNETKLRERRLQLNRETFQRDREIKKQNQQHEKRMFQMRIQLIAMKSKKMKKKKKNLRIFSSIVRISMIIIQCSRKHRKFALNYLSMCFCFYCKNRRIDSNCEISVQSLSMILIFQFANYIAIQSF